MRALPGVLVTQERVIAVAFTVGMASLSAAFGIMPTSLWKGGRGPAGCRGLSGPAWRW